MGETDPHRDMIVDLIEALKAYYRPQPNVYVSGNLLVLYDPADRNAHVSPDVFIVTDVPQRKRDNYPIWEEGKAPDLVIEVTSKTTKDRDTGFKKDLYEKLGVREYMLFDPRNEYLKPRFQVFRLQAGSYVPVLVQESVGYTSLTFGLLFRVVQDQLRVFETVGNTMLPNPKEQEEIARAQTPTIHALRDANENTVPRAQRAPGHEQRHWQVQVNS